MSTTKKKRSNEQLAKSMPILTGIAAVAYLLVGYSLLILPKLNAVASGGELDVTLYNERLEVAKSEASKLGTALTATVPEDTRVRVENMVPHGPDVPGLYVQLEAMAIDAGFQLVSIDSVPNQKGENTGTQKIVRTAINVKGGTYPQYKKFLTNLESSERIIDVQSVVFTPVSGSYGMVLRSYYVDPFAVPEKANGRAR